MTDKPPYRVPSMPEIAAIPWNGYNVISTFSGCGGSSLGYKMAGFNVLWANEFIPAAQETYRANHPDTILDTRDIRTVQASDILDALSMKPGELDVFDGSPPCASFSTAGKREQSWGKVKDYSDTKQRVDDLFFEYARLLRGLQPKVFIAENVSGLVKGTAKGYFLEILAALKDCGYKVEARLLDAQWLGVPQMRQRLIFCGVRSDLDAAPAFPKPLPYQYSVQDAIGVGFRPKSYAANDWIEGSKPAAAIQASGQYFVELANGLESAGRGTGHIWKNVTRAPMPTVQADRPVRVAVVQTGVYNEGERRTMDGQGPSITVSGLGAKRIEACSVETDGEKRKFTIAELKRICAFPDDFIFTGTYAQQWERMGRAVPPVMMSHIAAAVRDNILCRLPR